MDETERVREYLEGQIRTHTGTLDYYLKQKAEAEENIERLRKTLGLLEGMLEYMRQAEGQRELPLFEEGLEEEQPYAEMSIADAAFELLKQVGRPLHVTRIWEELQRGGKTLEAKKPTLSVTGALLRDERFENLGKNTFRIKEIPSDPDGDGYAKS